MKRNAWWIACIAFVLCIGSVCAGSVDALLPIHESQYIIRVCDEYENALQGVLLRLCNGDVCMVLQTDEQGMCCLQAEALPWELHVLMAPIAYEVPAEDIMLDENACELTIVLKQKEDQ